MRLCVCISYKKVSHGIVFVAVCVGLSCKCQREIFCTFTQTSDQTVKS